MRKSGFARLSLFAKRASVLPLIACMLWLVQPDPVAGAETPAPKNIDVAALDILGIELGMSRSEVETLLKAKMEAGKTLDMAYELEDKHEAPYDVLEYTAARPENTESMRLTVYFSADQTDESRVILVHRQDKIEPIASATFYESLVKKYGVPTFESKGRQELIWSEKTAEGCDDGKQLFRSMKDPVTTACGVRLAVSLGPEDSLRSLEMVLKDERDRGAER